MHTLSGPYGRLGAFVRAALELPLDVKQSKSLPRRASGWMLVDTGVPQSGLCQSCAERLGLENRTRDSIICAMGVVRRDFKYRVNISLTLESSQPGTPALPKTYRTQPLRTNDAVEAATLFIAQTQPHDPEIIGHLGLDVLRHFLVTFDPFRQLCTLTLP